MNKIKLPPQVKLVIGIAITGTAIFIGYKIYKLIFDKQGREDKEREKEAEKNIQEQIIKEGKKVNASYNKAQYIAYADSIFNELNGCGAGRQDVVERALMAMKHDLDVLNLIQAYGNRQRTCLKVNTGEKDNLLTSLNDEWTALQASSRKKVNNDWANKKIKYKI
jgi:hypothetical protein